MKKYLYIIILITTPWFLSAQDPSMTIGTGAIVTIGVGASVSVGTAAASGTVTTAATTSLVIQSTASGTGSLICGGTPNGTVQRYVTENAWHLVSPSTTGVTANNFYWSDAPKAWLVYHTEATNGWTYNTSLATSMPVGQGWLLWLDDNTKQDATATMTGALRSADLSPTITWSDADHSFNLVGNPFPSAIDLGDGTGWTFTNTEETIWVYDAATSNYKNRTTGGGGTMANGIIPVGQGFFVHASGSSPVFTIPASARIHSTQAFYKGPNQTSGYEAYAIITATQDKYADEVWVSFGENGSPGFENGWDASKMFGDEEAPQLFLTEGGRDLSIDHLYTLGENERIVSMSFIAGVEGQQTLTANLDRLPNSTVVLEDQKTGQFHQFHQNPVYSFTGSKEDDPARFLLHFKSTAYGIDDPGSSAENNIDIYSFDKTIYIYSRGKAVNEAGVLKLYDLSGRILAEERIGSGDLVKVPVNFSNTYLVAKVIKESEVRAEKVYIN